MTTTTSSLSPAIKLRSTRDVLAAIPHLLGYRPAECVVVVAAASTGRVGPVAHVTRADLPLLGTAGVGVLARRIAETGADRAIIAVYTDAASDAQGVVLDEVAPLMAELAEVLDDVEPWLVTSDRYRGLDCADPACCPPEGHPRDQLETGAVSAAFVVAGSSIAPTAAAAFAIPRAAVAARDLAGRAARRWQRAGDAARDDGAARRAWERDSHAAWRDAVRRATTELELCAADEHAPPAPAPAAPATLGRIAAALADTAVRDAVLLSLVTGTCGPGGAGAGAGAGASAGASASAGAGPGEERRVAEQEVAEACARLVDPEAAVAPDRAAAAAARAVLEAVVAHVPRRLQPAPLTLLGLLAWWRGEGGLAGARVREARAIDGGYRLASLMEDVLAAAVPPGWVRRSSEEWVG